MVDDVQMCYILVFMPTPLNHGHLDFWVKNVNTTILPSHRVFFFFALEQSLLMLVAKIYALTYFQFLHSVRFHDLAIAVQLDGC